MNNIDVKTLISYVINLLVGIVGFFLVASYNRTNEALAQINKEIMLVNREMVNMKIELVELNNKILTEERVKELIKLELSNK